MKGSSHSQAAGAQAGRRRRWGWLLPLLVGAAFLAEIAFLGRLDMAKNAEAVESWTTSFYRRSAHWGDAVGGGAVPRAGGGGGGDGDGEREVEADQAGGVGRLLAADLGQLVARFLAHLLAVHL